MLLVLLTLGVVTASDVGATFGDGAVSQVLRRVAAKALEKPRVVDLFLQSRADPLLSSLAEVDIVSVVDYKNLSVQFHPNQIHLIVERLSLDTRSHISEIFWPLGIGDKKVNVSLKFNRGEIQVDINEESLNLRNCEILNPSVETAVHDHWFADKGASVLASLVRPSLETILCGVLTKYLEDVKHSQIAQLPVYELIPEKARHYLTAQNATAFYKLRSIRVEENQLTVLARLEWVQIMENGELLPLSNASSLDVELHERDMVTFWLEDSLLNNLLAQVDWNFEWMDEKIAVNTDIIPPASSYTPESPFFDLFDFNLSWANPIINIKCIIFRPWGCNRSFLETLCPTCYFQVNVAAKGQPTIQATNESLVFEKRDRVHLRVVNPETNASTVFVSFVITILAGIKPSFDAGTLRTQVALLDTNITMEEGAFPQHWGTFMEDLMKGMIKEFIWPEMEKAVEELTYSKGLIFTPACGMDPNYLAFEIDEGTMAFSTKLLLESLNPEDCINGLKRSLPNTSKILKHIKPKQLPS